MISDKQRKTFVTWVFTAVQVRVTLIKGPFLRYHASVSWLPMSTVHATEAWTLKNGVLMTFVFCMEDLQVEFFHCGILLLDDTINYLRRTGKIKYSVSVRRYN